MAAQALGQNVRRDLIGTRLNDMPDRP